MNAFLLALLLAQGTSKVLIQRGPDEPARAQPEAAGFTVIKRVYVDKFTGGAAADHLREMVISSLQNSRLFIVTEEQDNADAILKGSAEADTFKDVHISSENSHMTRRGSKSSSMLTQGHFSTREQSSASNDSSAGASDSSHIEERKHEASAAVRLVLKNGDVIWSTTQESLGAKFRGASADVADKITRQLSADWPKLRRVE